MKNKISKCVTGFRKSHATQHSLIVMLEKWKKALDKEENMSVIFMDLSNAFDTISHAYSTSKTKGLWFLKISIKFHV